MITFTHWLCGHCQKTGSADDLDDAERQYHAHIEVCPDRPFWRMKP